MDSNDDRNRVLIKHILDNSREVVHDRGAALFEKERVIVETYDGNIPESGTFYVEGKTGNYRVTFSGGKEAPKTYCNCPYNHGGLCKHEVAVLLQVLNISPGWKKNLYSDEEVSEDLLEEDNPETAVTTRNKDKQSTEEITQSPTPSDITNQGGKGKEQLSSKQSQNGPKMKKSAKSKQQKTSGPVLHIMQLQDADDLYKYYYKNQLSYASPYPYESRLDDFNLNKLTFTAEPYNPFLRIKEYQVTMHFDEHAGNVITCTCGKKSDNFCTHQISVLESVAFDDELRYFYKIARQLPEFKAQAIKEYGLQPGENFEKDFRIYVEENGELSIIPVEPGRMKLAEYIDPEFTVDLKRYKEVQKIFATGHVPLPQDEHDEYKVGYLLRITDPYSLPPLLLDPILGRTVKAGDRFKRGTQVLNSISDPEVFKHGQTFFRERKDPFDFSKTNEKKALYKKMTLYHEQMMELFRALEDKLVMAVKYSGEVYQTFGDPVKVIGDTYPELYYKVKEEGNFYKMEACLDIDGETIPLFMIPNINDITPLCVWLPDGRLFLQPSAEAAFLYFNASEAPIKSYPKSHFSTFFVNVIEPLNKIFRIEMDIQEKTGIIEPEKVEKNIYLSELDKYILFSPCVDYGHKEVELFHEGNVWINTDEQVNKLLRDEKAEEEYKKLLMDAHPEFSKQTRKGILYLTAGQLLDNMWFFSFFEMLEKAGVNVYGREKLKNFRMNLNKPNFNVSVKSGIDWFDTQVEINFGDQTLPIETLQNAILNKNSYVKLSDGTLGMLPEEWINKLEALFQTGTVDKKKNNIRHAKSQFNIIHKLHDSIDNEKVLREIEKKKQKLTNFEKIKNKQLPAGLNAELRPYQRSGYNWLHFLNEFGFGGCLADDMGLGKTLQMLTFLLKQKKENKKTSLIIVPNSLIFNWKEESRKFTPELDILVHHGTSREKDSEKFKKHDIVLTTYGTLVNDIEFIGSFPFNYAVLDESQAIKNPASLRFKAVRLITAKNRLVLTGTPIENNTYDLYAQMQFVNPGLLGNQSLFKKHFSDPIDKEGSEKATATLRTLIHPFILRRTKEQVIKELPGKTENVLYCDMRSEQKALYDYYRKMYRDQILGKIEEDGLNKSKMHVLQALNKLRQICNSPALIKDENYANHSVKLELLKSHINDYRDNHKILIFSQFVEMLKLIRNDLDKENFEYAYLDGKTKDRQQVVEHFQEDENCRVFLISLKAGGQGLNLTAADYVYLVDPWWNPAVERQAIDRTYRIGQDKSVFAYRMICTGTIEEKILKLQEKKQSLSEDLIKTEESFVKSLKKEDIKNLFE